jgi:hypothetical protein
VCLVIGACVLNRKHAGPSPQAAAPFKVATEQEWIINKLEDYRGVVSTH